MKINVNDKEVHINEYHFIHLMGQVKSIGTSTKKHTVILDHPYNITTLRMAAAKSNGRNFKHDNHEWMWNGPGELVPADGPDVVNLSGTEIEALRSYAQHEVEPSSEIKKGRDFGPAYKELQRIVAQASKSQSKSDSQGLGISFARKLLPRPQVKYATGKPGEAFVWGPNGSKEEYPHIHLFLDTDNEAEIVTIREAKATLGPEGKGKGEKRHLPINSSGKVVGGSPNDTAVISELESVFAALETGIYSGGGVKTVASSSIKTNNNNNNNNNDDDDNTTSTQKVEVEEKENSVLAGYARTLGMAYKVLVEKLLGLGLSPDDAAEYDLANIRQFVAEEV
jgi:hypothetical protein